MNSSMFEKHHHAELELLIRARSLTLSLDQWTVLRARVRLPIFRVSYYGSQQQ